MHGCHVSPHMSPLGTMAMHGCHVSSQMAPPSNQVEHVLLLMMTINGIPITLSFLVRFGCSSICIYVCVCVCVRACMRVCVCVCAYNHTCMNIIVI